MYYECFFRLHNILSTKYLLLKLSSMGHRHHSLWPICSNLVFLCSSFMVFLCYHVQHSLVIARDQPCSLETQTVDWELRVKTGNWEWRIGVETGDIDRIMGVETRTGDWGPGLETGRLKWRFKN